MGRSIRDMNNMTIDSRGQSYQSGQPRLGQRPSFWRKSPCGLNELVTHTLSRNWLNELMDASLACHSQHNKQALFPILSMWLKRRLSLSDNSRNKIEHIQSDSLFLKNSHKEFCCCELTCSRIDSPQSINQTKRCAKPLIRLERLSRVWALIWDTIGRMIDLAPIVCHLEFYSIRFAVRYLTNNSWR